LLEAESVLEDCADVETVVAAAEEVLAELFKPAGETVLA
jgi:hypothetical protein